MLFSILFFVCFCVSPFKVVWRFFAGLGTASEDVETMSVGQVGLRDEREHTEKERERDTSCQQVETVEWVGNGGGGNERKEREQERDEDKADNNTKQRRKHRRT